MYTTNEIIEKLFAILDALEWDGCLSKAEKKLIEELKKDYYWPE